MAIINASQPYVDSALLNRETNLSYVFIRILHYAAHKKNQAFQP